MRWFVFVTSLFFLTNVIGQEPTISGIVNSGSFLGPIGKVHVRMGKNSTKTNYKGEFSLPYSTGEALVFSHSTYNSQRIPAQKLNTSSTHTFYLTPTSNLSSVVLLSEGAEEVYNPQFEHVFDFTFLNDTLIVLSYMHLGKTNDQKNIKPYINCALSVFKYGELIQRQILPDYIQKLNLAPSGELYFEGADTCFVLNRNRESIEVKGIDLKKYRNFTALAYAENTHGIFFSHSYPYIPQIAHKMYSETKDETYLLEMVQNHAYFNKVEDDYAMLSESEVKAALELEESTSINHQMFSTYLRSFYILRDISMPYAPGFLVNKEILIFDHMNNQVNYFTSKGVYIGSVQFYHNSLQREDLVKMLQDPYDQSLYTLHNKSGILYLREVDTNTAATGRPFKLHYPFAENVKVFENYVYYLRKSPKDEKIKYLVREKLPFSSSNTSEVNDLYFIE